MLSGSALMAVGGVCLTLIPMWLGHVVDAVIAPAASGAPPGPVWRELVLSLALLGGMYLVIVVSQRLGNRTSWYGIERAEYELGQRLLDVILRRTGPDRLLPGELISRLTADVRRSCQVLHTLVEPPGELVQVVVTAVLLWSFHPWLGITLLAGAPLMLAGMHLAARPIDARVEEELDALGETAGAASDVLGGHRSLRGLHAEETAADRYATVSRRALAAAVRSRSTEAWFEGLTELTGGLFVATLVSLATFLAVTGRLSIGQLASVTGLSVGVLWSLSNVVSNVTGLWATARGANRRILGLAAPGDAGEAAPETPAAKIPVAGFTVVRVTDAELRATTDALVAALPGAVLTPHPEQLLAGSVLDNVRMTGEVPASREQAIEALRRVGLEAAELADGYDTDTGDNGSSLSGGQRQRVALARAVAAEPEVLILVNPTSSVDTVTEQHIAEQLHRAREGRVTVVVSDSPIFRAAADRVVEVQP